MKVEASRVDHLTTQGAVQWSQDATDLPDRHKLGGLRQDSHQLVEQA